MSFTSYIVGGRDLNNPLQKQNMFERCQCSLSDSNSDVGFVVPDLSICSTGSVGIPNLGTASHCFPIQYLTALLCRVHHPFTYSTNIPFCSCALQANACRGSKQTFGGKVLPPHLVLLMWDGMLRFYGTRSL